jgi:dolichol-phosphate mannosyltransferase
MKKSITILILAYNEEKNLEDTVHKSDKIVREMFNDYELIICDDGSTDRTGDIAEQLEKKNPRIRVLHNKKNVGQGHAYKKSLQMARKEYVTWVAGDNDVEGESIRNLFQHTGEVDLLINYIENTGARPLYRQIISATYTNFLNILFGLNLKYYNGSPLCKTKLVRSVNLTTNSNGLWAELVIKLIKTGHSYKEIPMRIRKKEMSGNIFRLKDIIGVIRTVTKLIIMFIVFRNKNRQLK